MLRHAVLVTTLTAAALAAETPSVTALLPEYKLQIIKGASALTAKDCKATYAVDMSIDAIPFAVPVTITQDQDTFHYTASISKDKFAIQITGACSLLSSSDGGKRRAAGATCATTRTVDLAGLHHTKTQSTSIKDKDLHDAMYTVPVTANAGAMAATSTCTGKSALAGETQKAEASRNAAAVVAGRGMEMGEGSVVVKVVVAMVAGAAML